MKRRIAAIIIVAVLVTASSVFAFMSIGMPTAACPLVLLGSGYPIEGKSSFRIAAVGDQSGPPAGSGTFAWCLYGSLSLLQKGYLTNRLLAEVAASGDGAFVAAAGYQISPGPAGVYVNGAVYLFDKWGDMKWNFSTSQPIFSVHINSNGSVIVANDPELQYLSNEGKVLWSYLQYESSSVVLLNDGSNVLAGVSGILYPQHVNYGSVLTMFDSKGRVLWNITIPDQIFDSTRSLATSDSDFAAGLTSTGYKGTLYFYNLEGGLVWSRQVDSAIGRVDFQNSGSTIFVETNWGHVTFDLTGNVVENQTMPHTVLK